MVIGIIFIIIIGIIFFFRDKSNNKSIDNHKKEVESNSKDEMAILMLIGSLATAEKWKEAGDACVSYLKLRPDNYNYIADGAECFAKCPDKSYLEKYIVPYIKSVDAITENALIYEKTKLENKTFNRVTVGKLYNIYVLFLKNVKTSDDYEKYRIKAKNLI